MKAAPVQGRAGELLLPDLIKGSNMMVINWESSCGLHGLPYAYFSGARPDSSIEVHFIEANLLKMV